MKVAQLKQNDNEDIADYLNRAGELSRKMPTDEIEIGMATLRGMHYQQRLQDSLSGTWQDDSYQPSGFKKLMDTW